MTNNEKYFFSDFTHSEYKNLIKLAKNKWRFCTYSDFQKHELFILWRHDVDYNVKAALHLARIEADLGIKSTFFVLPHSEFYNLFEKETTDMVKEISSLGHEIGLHFDTNYYGIEEEQSLRTRLTQEKRWLEEIFENEITVFSFHNTSKFTMSCDAWQYADMINSYASYFQKQVVYCSDSNGYWRFKRLKDVLEQTEGQPLQILTHPEWWLEEVLSPFDKVKRTVHQRAETTLNYYVNHLKKHNRENIDWE